MTLRDALNTTLSALFTPPCARCGAVLTSPLAGAVCDACWSAVQLQRSLFVLPHVAFGSALGPYDGALRDLLHVLKYDGRRSVARPLSRLLRAHAHDVLHGADCVIPVPLHRRRARERGFNQAEDLAVALVTPVWRILRRVRSTRPQVGLSADERRDNVDGAFALRTPRPWPAAVRDLRGATVVLIDDVATTGATLESCAVVLRDAGAREVRALTAARVADGALRGPQR